MIEGYSMERHGRYIGNGKSNDIGIANSFGVVKIYGENGSEYRVLKNGKCFRRYVEDGVVKEETTDCIKLDRKNFVVSGEANTLDEIYYWMVI